MLGRQERFARDDRALRDGGAGAPAAVAFLLIRSRARLTHFEVKTVSASRPPSEPFSIVLLTRTSAAVAMASLI